jgi:hypothetical protein
LLAGLRHGLELLRRSLLDAHQGRKVVLHFFRSQLKQKNGLCEML